MAGAFGVWLERLAIGEFVVDILQTRFPEWRNNRNRPVAGIIELGGTFSGQKSPGARASRHSIGATFSEGKSRFLRNGGDRGRGRADAAQMFVAAGVGPKRIMIEGRSRNTAENTAFSQILVQPDKGSRWDSCHLGVPYAQSPRRVQSGGVFDRGLSGRIYILTPSAKDANIRSHWLIIL
jgi:hypothetical protein